MEKRKEKQVITLQVTEGLEVAVIPDSNHEFLMSTDIVALGYETSEKNIREHKRTHPLELIEGKHFISGARISGSDPHNKVYWTKRGIVRLGFFIKSERARLFRDWAEDLVINQSRPRLPERTKFESQEEYRELYELVEAAAEICGSNVKLGERLGIAPSTFSHILRRPWLVSIGRMKLIERGCRNIIQGGGADTDVRAIESLLQIEDRQSRMYLFNKMKKGGLL